jgi:oxygen-dependent protoporphyrinogen oxidase
MTIQGGIGAIPDALATLLDVRPSTPVVQLEICDRGVTAVTDAGEFQVDHVIVAAPAHVAQDLLSPNATPAEAELLACTYSATVNVCLGLRYGYQLPKALRDVYGFLIPAREREHIAAVSIERNKSPDRAKGGELVAVFLSGEAADRLLATSDADVLAAVLPELERYLPGVDSAVTMTHLVRWPAAEPRSPVGRARAVAAYRAAPRPDRRVLLAGDYVALPWTDGAAESGAWAAAEVIGQ